MTAADIDDAISLLKPLPPVHYRDWEERWLLEAHLRSPSGPFNFIALADSAIIGALIGGSFGVRGTISHVGVRPDWQRRGAGRLLVNDALTAFARSGITRVFVLIERSNLAGQEFWRSMGLDAIETEQIRQVDL